MKYKKITILLLTFFIVSSNFNSSFALGEKLHSRYLGRYNTVFNEDGYPIIDGDLSYEEGGKVYVMTFEDYCIRIRKRMVLFELGLSEEGSPEYKHMGIPYEKQIRAKFFDLKMMYRDIEKMYSINLNKVLGYKVK